MGSIQISNPPEDHFDFDVALSFAEESRDFVKGVADQLKKKGLRIYYDDDERVSAWGKVLKKRLEDVYLKEARFCVIFISAHYKLKRWAQYEQGLARARAFFAENEAYILPFRLDDTEIAGITDTVIYLSAQTHNDTMLADAIIEKVRACKNDKPVLNHAIETETLQHTETRLWKIKSFFSEKIRLGIVALVVIIIGVLRFYNHDHPEQTNLVNDLQVLPRNPSLHIQKLTNPVQEKKVSQKIKKPWLFKAVCRDGWLSKTNGPGTCSCHGGIDHKVDTTVYGETEEGCRDVSMKAFRIRDSMIRLRQDIQL